MIKSWLSNWSKTQPADAINRINQSYRVTSPYQRRDSSGAGEFIRVRLRSRRRLLSRGERPV